MQLLRELVQRVANGEMSFKPTDDTQAEVDRFQLIANRLIEAKDQGYIRDIRYQKESSSGKRSITTVLVIDGITFKGEQLLATPVDELPQNHLQPSPISSLDVFVSHASDDTEIASAFIALLQIAIPVDPKRVRCTSVAGYRLQAGDNFNDQLRRDVLDSSVFVALLSPSSIRSTYVLFELGARWASRRHLAPILISGLTASHLDQPLASLHAADATSASDMLRLIETLATRLKSTPAEPGAFARNLSEFSLLSNKIARGGA